MLASESRERGGKSQAPLGNSYAARMTRRAFLGTVARSVATVGGVVLMATYFAPAAGAADCGCNANYCAGGNVCNAQNGNICGPSGGSNECTTVANNTCTGAGSNTCNNGGSNTRGPTYVNTCNGGTDSNQCVAGTNLCSVGYNVCVGDANECLPVTWNKAQ